MGPPRLCAINTIGRLIVCIVSVSINSFFLAWLVEFVRLLMISFPTSHRLVAPILFAGIMSHGSLPQ